MYRVFILFYSLVASALFGTAAEFGEVLWQFETDDSVTSSPGLDSAGNVYFGSLDGYVYSVDRNGVLRWRYDASDWVDSSPALSRDDSTVYVGSWDNAVLALSSNSGELLWKFATDSLVYASPAVAADGTIYVGSSDGQLYALAPGGALKWEFEVGGELDSSPAIDGDGNVYVGSDAGFVTCLDPAGVELWTWEVPTELNAVARDFGVLGSPMLTAAGDVIVGCQNHYVYSLDAATGAQRWKYETGAVVESSLVEGMGRSCVLGGRDGYLYSFSWDGALNWRVFAGGNYYSTPCVDGMGRIYTGVLRNAEEGSLLVYSSTGELLWKTDFGSFVDSSPVLAADGALLVGNNDGRLYAIEGGDKLASLGWSSFRGGADQRRSLQGYSDETATVSELQVESYQFAATDGALASYRVEGGGPLRVKISALGSGLKASGESGDYAISLFGSSGAMAFAGGFTAGQGSEDGSLEGWLEPGFYTIEAINQSEDRAALFIRIDLR